MSERSTKQIRELLDSLYRVDSGRILATLIRLLGDFDLAEEAMHEAFAAALSARTGVPACEQNCLTKGFTPGLRQRHTTATLTLWIGGSESNRQSHCSPPSLPIHS
jgi:hypothetical protein